MRRNRAERYAYMHYNGYMHCLSEIATQNPPESIINFPINVLDVRERERAILADSTVRLWNSRRSGRGRIFKIHRREFLMPREFYQLSGISDRLCANGWIKRRVILFLFSKEVYSIAIWKILYANIGLTWLLDFERSRGYLHKVYRFFHSILYCKIIIIQSNNASMNFTCTNETYSNKYTSRKKAHPLKLRDPVKARIHRPQHTYGKRETRESSYI